MIYLAVIPDVEPLAVIDILELYRSTSFEEVLHSTAFTIVTVQGSYLPR